MSAQVKHFPRQVAAIQPVFEFLEEFFRERGIRPASLFNASLVVEELFTNLVRHTVGGHHEITVSLADEDGELVIKFTDRNVEPWDPTKAPPFDPAQPLESRPLGGMGLHLVRNLAQSFTYEYHEGNSVTTVRMRLSE
jgi:anti-sigma regulatory factor (Ser/Thr protein kinase)